MDTAKKKKEKEKNQHQDDRDSTLAKELPDGRSLGEFGWEIENLPSKTFFFSFSFLKLFIHQAFMEHILQRIQYSRPRSYRK